MIRVLVWLFVTLGVSFVLACLGAPIPFEVVFYLSCGWALFLFRVLPQATVDLESVATGTVALGLFVVGLHSFLRWLTVAWGEVPNSTASEGLGSVDARRWRFRWTAAISMVIVLMFAAGITMVGLTHQTIWMFRSNR